MAELDLINVVILIGAGLVVFSALTSLLSMRLGVPLLLIFLGIGLATGEDGIGQVHFDNAPLAFFIGAVALAVILFDAGFETPWRSYRLAAGPGLTMATAGVLITSSLVAVAAHFTLQLDWTASFMLGAIVSSTDAAAVFLLLRMSGTGIRDRVRSTLEIESGSNDPIAIFLTIGLAELARQPDLDSILLLVPDFLLQLGMGAVGGALGGFGIVRLVNRVKLEEGLYPLVVVGMGLGIFALLNAIGGSGFLGVYIAGLVAGNARLHGAPAIRRFQTGLAWLCQIGMFVTLGLLATPSDFGSVLWQAGVVAAVLILVARPLAAWLCLLPFGFGRRETAFIGWVGLRGAVSIMLAIVPLMTGLPGAHTLFNVTFIVVIISLLVQGWSVRPAAKLLRQTVPLRQGPADRVELPLPGQQSIEMVSYTVRAGSPVARGQHLPRWARPGMILRDGQEIDVSTIIGQQADGRAETGLLPGDYIYIFAQADKVPLLDKLLAGQVELSAEDREFFGDFAVPADITLTRLSEEYGLPSPPDIGHRTLADHFAETFGDVEIGDRLRHGGVDLVVTEQEGGRAQQVGLVLDPPAPDSILFLPTGRELWNWLKGRLTRRPEPPAADTPALATPAPAILETAETKDESKT